MQQLEALTASLGYLGLVIVLNLAFKNLPSVRVPFSEFVCGGQMRACPSQFSPGSNLGRKVWHHAFLPAEPSV